MRWLLLLLLLVPAEADARRSQRVLVVRDYTSAAWDGMVAQTVDDFNAVMPKRGPRLRYRRGEGACQVSAEAVAVCSDPDALNSRAESVWNGKRTRLLRSVVTMTDQERGFSFDDRRHWLCHELMHALTGIPDNYGALPDQSCVWGELSQPGPFDVEQLRKAYGKRR